MDISASYTFKAPPGRVWDLLMTPDAIASCIPGCDRFDPDGEDRYRARLTVALSAVTGTYDAVVTLSDKIAGTSYRLTGEGQGRAGFVRGSAAISLRADGDDTIVDVNASVHAGGAIARVGQRILGSVGKMMLDRFFTCLQSKT
jgi:carbon monoxide dehydrogenase subunit G